jgi:dTDP-4-amino-4,6-dideoxygalactose transaminase
MNWNIPLSDLNFDEAEEHAVVDVIRSRWLTMGPRTEEFEARMAEALGVAHAVAVANGTCALQLAYGWALETWRASQPATSADKPVFIVPDVTFVATANAALAMGAEAWLVDAATPDDPRPTVESFERLAAQAGSRLAAIVCVHFAGYDAHAVGMRALADKLGVLLIEDTAHAVGGRTRIDAAHDASLGAVGHLGCFSFFSNKNLATGEGGLVTTNSPEAAAWVRRGRSHGLTSQTYQRHQQTWRGYDVEMPGFNFRCTEITAALGLAQLAKLPAGNARRLELTRAYQSEFLRLGAPVSVALAGDEALLASSSCHILPALCANVDARDAVRAALAEAGIQCSHHYQAIHNFRFYHEHGTTPRDGGESGDAFANATAFAEREVTLPLWPTMTDEQVRQVAEVVARGLARSSA